ncbi:MAG: hypothetical protein ACOC5T_02310 [Elusimicrobiota bacterium]
MELKIRDKEEEREPACEFWLEKNKDRIELMSKKEGESRIEFSIKPDGNWIKCIAGNLNDEERE